MISVRTSSIIKAGISHIINMRAISTAEDNKKQNHLAELLQAINDPSRGKKVVEAIVTSGEVMLKNALKEHSTAYDTVGEQTKKTRVQEMLCLQKINLALLNAVKLANGVKSVNDEVLTQSTIEALKEIDNSKGSAFQRRKLFVSLKEGFEAVNDTDGNNYKTKFESIDEIYNKQLFDEVLDPFINLDADSELSL